jgi:hypothetical protein
MKPKPKKTATWWALVDLEDPDDPKILCASRSREEIKQAAWLVTTGTDRLVAIDQLDYDASRLIIHRRFSPHRGAQLKALRRVLDWKAEK